MIILKAETAELLLYTDFDFNQRSFLGNTPFMLSCRFGHTEIVNLMVNSSVELGIDLNARNDNGETGFMLACRRNHKTIVDLISNLSREFGIDLV